MNPVEHSKISVRKRGGKVDDYYPLHSFIDSTKELCSDNRHRVLHTHWGIRRIIIPLFGHTLKLSNGKEVNVKDICEQDHILPDYRNKFIPTIIDFIDEFEALDDKEKIEINRIHNIYKRQERIQEILMSPFRLSGQLKSLRLTYNGWFCNEIIPKIIKEECPKPESHIRLFEKINFAQWMDNGIEYPKSITKISDLI